MERARRRSPLRARFCRSRSRFPQARASPTSCDLLPLIDAFDRQPFHVKQIARELQRSAGEVIGERNASRATLKDKDEEVRHALWVGYADRLGKRREGDPDRVLLATGHGASLARESGVRDGDYLVALDVVASQRDGTAEARIRAASRVERDWIRPTSTAVEHRIDRASGRVRAWRVARFDEIVLAEHPVPPDPVIAAGLLRDAWLAQEHDERTAQLLRRLRFAGIDVDLPAIVGAAAMNAAGLAEIQLESQLPSHTRRSLDERAPASLVVPSGRSMPLEYADDGSVSTSVKLQELFGLAQSPAIGPNRTLVTFHLLAPNGRPVQTTRDLRSFWQRTYPEVRKELRARYPKHPWPEDPWTAPPTHRTRRR